MCRKHSSDDDSCKNNSTVDSPAQAFFPPLRIVTQPTAPGDRDRARKVIDTNNLDEQDLKNLKKNDRFLYYYIPTVVRDAIRAKAKAKVVSNDTEEFQLSSSPYLVFVQILRHNLGMLIPKSNTIRECHTNFCSCHKSRCHLLLLFAFHALQLLHQL